MRYVVGFVLGVGTGFVLMLFIANDRLSYLDTYMPILEYSNYKIGCLSVATDKKQCAKNADLYFKNNEIFWKQDLDLL